MSAPTKQIVWLTQCKPGFYNAAGLVPPSVCVFVCTHVCVWLTHSAGAQRCASCSSGPCWPDFEGRCAEWMEPVDTARRPPTRTKPRRVTERSATKTFITQYNTAAVMTTAPGKRTWVTQLLIHVHAAQLYEFEINNICGGTYQSQQVNHFSGWLCWCVCNHLYRYSLEGSEDDFSALV